MNVKFNKLLSLLMALFYVLLAVACSTNDKNLTAKGPIEGDEILSSSNGKLDYPAWAYETPRFIDDGKINVSGNVDISAEQSPSRCLDAAALVARANLASEIKNRLQGQFQYAAEGMGLDEHRLDSIINQASEVQNLAGTHTSSRWYAKVKIANGSDTKATYRCFALVSMPVELFKKQLLAELNRANEGKKLTPEFNEKVKQSWDQFFGTTQTPSEKELESARTPAVKQAEKTGAEI